MFITNILFEKNRFTISFDLDNDVTIPEDVLVKYNLYKGMEVSDDFREVLERESEKTEALLISYKYLRNLKTKKQLKDYLFKKKINRETIDEVVDELEEKGYVDDYDYAVKLIRDSQNINRDGKRKIIYKLRSKGIKQDVIDEAMSFYDFDKELENINYLYKNRLKMRGYNEKEILSCKNYLVNKGFEYENINSEMNDIDE